MTWATFEAAAPDIAAAGRRLIHRTETGEVLLATVRGDDPPRIHPIYVAIVDGRLYAFIIRSGPKFLDLERDGRYAMHTHQDPAAPSEFACRGHARPVIDAAVRATVAAAWSFEVDDTYGLFEFDIDSAVLGARATADDWPPVYSSWRAPKD
jgi:hypothetical protein